MYDSVRKTVANYPILFLATSVSVLINETGVKIIKSVLENFMLSSPSAFQSGQSHETIFATKKSPNKENDLIWRHNVR